MAGTQKGANPKACPLSPAFEGADAPTIFQPAKGYALDIPPKSGGIRKPEVRSQNGSCVGVQWTAHVYTPLTAGVPAPVSGEANLAADRISNLGTFYLAVWTLDNLKILTSASGFRLLTRTKFT